MRCRIAELVVLVALTLAITRETATAAPASPVDASTIRVFAVGTVGTESVDTLDRKVTVAHVNAGHGTGFVVDSGLIMTAHHVVDGARHVVVRLPGDGGFFPARIVYADKAKDIALLAVDGKLPAALALTPEPPRVRSTVFAVGYPLDATRRQPQSARGIIAGYLDDGTVQVDMALNPGNSGGPVVNEQDAVVGMAIARGRVEQGVQGIGYAVPVHLLQAAVIEAKRRVASGDLTASGLSADSATVVDELVQHGALYELRRVTDIAGAPKVDLDRVLAELIARIHDPDLLVFVAGAMWNVSIALDYADPAKLELTRAQASSLSSRLRTSSVTAVRHALQLDRTVGARSTFVALAMRGRGGSLGGLAFEAAAETAAPTGATQSHVLLQAAPITRFNLTTGSTGLGVGGNLGLAFGRRDQTVLPLIGMGVGRVGVSTSDGEFAHTLVAAQLGLLVRIGKVNVTAELEGFWYSASVESAMSAPASGSASDVGMSFRCAVGYRLSGPLEVGAGARIVGGETVWLEPLYAALAF